MRSVSAIILNSALKWPGLDPACASNVNDSNLAFTEQWSFYSPFIDTTQAGQNREIFSYVWRDKTNLIWSSWLKIQSAEGDIVWWDHGLDPYRPTFSWKRVSFSSRFSHDSTTRGFTLVSLTRNSAFKRYLLNGTNFKKTLLYVLGFHLFSNSNGQTL